mmetsp:Transcript_29256/g.35646  ORF Transcript_29256/g.35646 Transcript_29256/m.35646 type:complete len:94 (-) Transcript_29256:525-806(-)
MILFIRRVLAYNAEKIVVNPMKKSQGTARHILLHSSGECFSSSNERGIMVELKIMTPINIMKRNIGCDDLMTRIFRNRAVTTIKKRDVNIEML